MKDIDYTIKPLTTSIEIKTLRRLIASWYSNGVTDKNIIRFLKLYFGESAWMDIGKNYPCNMFGQIAKGLGFHTRHDFLEILTRCKGFGFIWRDDQSAHTDSNLLAFYSPIWHTANNMNMDEYIDAKLQNVQDSSKNEKNCTRYIDNNINNKKKRIEKKNTSNNISGCKNLQGSENREAIDSAAKRLINYIGTNPDAYAAIVKPINEITLKLMPELDIDYNALCPATQATACFFNKYLYPYLKEHSERMMGIKGLTGQSCWIRNLVRKEFMQKNIACAVSDTRQYLRLHPYEMMRQYHPISAFEYQDKTSGQRFYDDTLKDGTLQKHRIPQEAPPRPSASAIWSKFEQKWKNA